MHMTHLNGALLVGGKSRRMGQDKAQMKMDGAQSQASRCLQLLQSSCDTIAISCANEESIPPSISDTQIILDTHGDLGPCGAILSIMESDPEADWLILACDYPLIDQETLNNLAAAIKSPKTDVKASAISYASRIDKRAEPLCAIYKSSTIAPLREWVSQGKRCARHFIESLDPTLLELPNMLALENANTLEELAEIQAKSKRPLVEKTITVLYFATLREQAGRNEENLTTTATTPAGVYDELRVLRQLNLDPNHLRVAINEEFAEWGYPLKDGDEVVFIPPVAGG